MRSTGELIEGIQPAHGGEDFVGDVLDGLGDAFADEAVLVAVAQFEGLVFAGAGAGGNRGAAGGAAGEEDVHFNGWVAAGIQNFTGFDVRNCAHGQLNVQGFKCHRRRRLHRRRWKSKMKNAANGKVERAGRRADEVGSR